MLINNLLKKIKYFKSVVDMQQELSGRKLLQKNKKLLDDLCKRRNVFFQGFQIYGGCGGLYDFGPVGCSIKTNIEQIWREYFILEQEMLEVSTTCVTPHIVLQHSGHVAKFTDLLVRDVKTGQGLRADKLIGEWIENKIEKGKLKQPEVFNFKKILSKVQSMTKQQMGALIKQLGIKSPETGNALTEPEPFNLMFKTQIGPSTNSVGYLRPETAQGMFVNFNKLYEFNSGRLPFGAAQIGLGFRNQIAPRNGLVRTREFQMAEIQYFVDPLDKRHPKFNEVAHIKLPLLSKQNQEQMKQHVWMEIGEAVAKKIVDNESLGYFMARIFLFLKEVGLNTDQHVRFRQHFSNEMAHYAKDCWDAESQLSSGWLEIVGCADRSAYDLTKHHEGSGVKLVASRKFKETRQELHTFIEVNRQVIGKQFKKNAAFVHAYIEKLTEQDKKVLKQKFQADKKIQIPLQEQNKAILTDAHIKIEQKIVNVNEEKFIPSVIEPSFGLGRILTSMFEHTFKVRDEKRTYLCLKPRVAPVKVSILPLQSDSKFLQIIKNLRKNLKYALISTKVDDTGQSIGKRYARTDEIGIPFGITVDYQTVEDQTVTLRELHTMKQLRVPLKQIVDTLTKLSNGLDTWEEVCQRFPAFEGKDE